MASFDSIVHVLTEDDIELPDGQLDDAQLVRVIARAPLGPAMLRAGGKTIAGEIVRRQGGLWFEPVWEATWPG